MSRSILIQGGSVADGTGRPPFRADVLARDGRIAEVGAIPEAEGARVLDAAGLTVAPGFIDAHTHLDFILASPAQERVLEKWVRQGVTTVVAGTCGFSPAPATDYSERYVSTLWHNALPREGLAFSWRSFGEYAQHLKHNGMVLNAAVLCGHNMLRANIMGLDARASTREEAGAMARELARALSEGAAGLSAGLFYVPGAFCRTEELDTLAAVLSGTGKPLVTHTRGLTQHYDKAVAEVAGVAERAGVPLQLSHHAGGLSLPLKVKRIYGRSTRAFLRAARLFSSRPLLFFVFSLNRARVRAEEVVRKARDRGVPVGCDNMPWFGGPTGILAMLPPWLFDGGMDRGLARLAEPGTRRRVLSELKSLVPSWPAWEHGFWTDNFLSLSALVSGFSLPKNRGLSGKSMEELGRLAGKDPFDALLDLTAEERGGLFAIDGLFDDPAGDDIAARLLADPECSVMSDVIGADYDWPNPVPWSSHAKVLGSFCRDRGHFTLPEAVRKMTSLPARQMGLSGRGEIRKGLAADICVFDPRTVRHCATFARPCRLAEGIRHVLVNGEPVLENERYLPATKPGVLL
ncbi:MAG: amidohydrolase family protein [Thermodesulfobacteriota bacterium]